MTSKAFVNLNYVYFAHLHITESHTLYLLQSPTHDIVAINNNSSIKLTEMSAHFTHTHLHANMYN